jgi:uncharacterized membrane protein YcaP (DUF421 family)
MERLVGVDWEQVFALQTPLLEIFVRGTVTYLVLFVLLRLLRREIGSFSVTDLLVVVLLADAAQNAMAGEYRSVTDGLLLIITIIGWSYTLDWLGFHVPAIGRLVHPPALPLVENGQLVLRNLRRQFITEEELESQLRREGIEDVAQVKKAYIEGDGSISVIRRDG